MGDRKFSRTDGEQEEVGKHQVISAANVVTLCSMISRRAEPAANLAKTIEAFWHPLDANSFPCRIQIEMCDRGLVAKPRAAHPLA